MLDLTLSSSLYQDSARTTPVTASGQPIGSVTDLSPNGKNASSTGGSRPLWNSLGYGTFDGFDDYMQTAAIDFTATDAVTVVASVRKLSDSSAAIIDELGPVYSSGGGRFGLFGPSSASPSFGAGAMGNIAAAAVYNNVAAAAPVTSVLCQEAKISTDLLSLRMNGVQVASSVADLGTGNFSSQALNIGARNGGAYAFFNGRISRLLVIGRLLTTTERKTAERWAAQPVGIVIP